MTDKTDLIREILEYVTTHGGENTATHLLVQAASAIQAQAAELEAVGAGGVQATPGVQWQCGQQASGFAAPQQEPVGVVEHAQAQTSYIHWTAAPPPNGAKLYTAPQQEAQEPVALYQVYRCKIKSRKQIDKEIPRELQGWWADVAAGQKLLLRQAVQSDLDRCTLGGKRSKDPDDYMCETQTNGSLVSKIALEYMNPEQNVFASTAPQPAPAPLSDDAKDAARYRWLRNESWAGYHSGDGSPKVFTLDGAGNRRVQLAEEAMDSAIDAARGAQGEAE